MLQAEFAACSSSDIILRDVALLRPEMPRKLSDELAAAHQRARDLSNELHQAKQVNLPLRGEVVGLTNERDRLQQKLRELVVLNESYRSALTGLVELVHSLAGGKS